VSPRAAGFAEVNAKPFSTRAVRVRSPDMGRPGTSCVPSTPLFPRTSTLSRDRFLPLLDTTKAVVPVVAVPADQGGLTGSTGGAWAGLAVEYQLVAKDLSVFSQLHVRRPSDTKFTVYQGGGEARTPEMMMLDTHRNEVVQTVGPLEVDLILDIAERT